MSTNKITLLQSLKLGAWWTLLSFLPVFFSLLAIGFIGSLAISISWPLFFLFLIAGIIVSLALLCRYFHKIFPVKFESFKIINTKKISSSTIILNYFAISTFTCILNTLLILLTILQGNFPFTENVSFINIFQILFGLIITPSLTAYFIVNSNPDSFEFALTDKDNGELKKKTSEL